MPPEEYEAVQNNRQKPQNNSYIPSKDELCDTRYGKPDNSVSSTVPSIASIPICIFKFWHQVDTGYRHLFGSNLKKK